MTDPATLRHDVDAILAAVNDPEVAHSMEDNLMRRLVQRYCAADVKAELERLWSSDFERWCG